MLHPGSMHPGEALVDLPMNFLSSHATVSRAPPQLAADPQCSEVLTSSVLTSLLEPCLKNGPGLAAVGEQFNWLLTSALSWSLPLEGSVTGNKQQKLIKFP